MLVNTSLLCRKYQKIVNKIRHKYIYFLQIKRCLNQDFFKMNSINKMKKNILGYLEIFIKI